jgi:hypothetical protein
MSEPYRCFVSVNQFKDDPVCFVTLEVPDAGFYQTVQRDMSEHDAMHDAAKLNDALRQAGTNIGEPKLRKVTE